jgi:hypothetical protein
MQKLFFLDRKSKNKNIEAKILRFTLRIALRISQGNFWHFSRITRLMFELCDSYKKTVHLLFIKKWKKLYTGTVPVLKTLYTGTVPILKTLYTGTVPVLKTLCTGTVPVLKTLYTGTVPVLKTLYTGTVPVLKTL